jgi:hypothetical protein
MLAAFLAVPVLSAQNALAAGEPEARVTLVSSSRAASLSGYQKQVLEYNQRIQRQNNAPAGFPNFVRDKFDITVVAEGYEESPDGAGPWPVLMVH